MLLLGDGCWETAPPAGAADLFPEVLTLSAIVSGVESTGWRLLHLSTADQQEWDEFESNHRRGGEEWLQNARDDELRRTLHERFLEYVTVYRGVLGFCYLLLRRDTTS
jgi:hypothetical protein